MFKDKVILITGGSGSWGNELASQLLTKEPREIIIFSRGEISQVAMERKFNDPRLTFVIGDVRNRKSVDNAMRRGVDYVYHLAALKHVPICENHPQEAIETNIIGSNNIIQSSIKFKVKKFIDVSSDKAVDPVNIYGMTKAIGEKLTIQANCLTDETEFICVRGGNVLGTNGSLVPYVIDQIKTKNEVIITDSKMTRFFLTLPEAIGLLFQATKEGIGGETYVMNMPSYHISDLIEILIEKYGNKHTKLNEIGAREGEKIHEVLISQHEINRTDYVDENYYVIYPQLKIDRTYYHSWNQEDYWNGKANTQLTHELSSTCNLKDKTYLINLLK